MPGDILKLSDDLFAGLDQMGTTNAGAIRFGADLSGIVCRMINQRNHLPANHRILLGLFLVTALFARIRYGLGLCLWLCLGFCG